MTSRAIRFYEKCGLFLKLPHNESGYRTIPEEVIPRLRLIVRARRLGLSLSEIREILSVFDEGEMTCETTRQVLLRKHERIRQAIEDFEALGRQIQELLKRCENSPNSSSHIWPVFKEAGKAIKSTQEVKR